MEDYHSLTSSINLAWSSIVGSTGETELRAIFILGDLLTGSEAGLPIPAAGEDRNWLKTYYKDFKRKADEGDEEFADLLTEIHERKDLEDAVEKA